MNRRKFLLSAAALPMVAIVPIKAQADSSKIHQLEGSVTLNNKRLTADSSIQSGDEIVVSHDGKLVFSMGQDAFLVRGGSVLSVIADDNLLISSLRLVTGAVLGVFGKRVNTTRIVTATATIGIRGTAVYVDATPHTCYTCTCYGRTDLVVGNQHEDVLATHHNAHVVTTTQSGSLQMQAFEVKGHNDDELRMLETLLGRKPSFDA